MEIGLKEEVRKKICEVLMKTLASTYALYLKTQNFHWNVVGKDFYALHLLFEKQYEALAEAIDEIAERNRALGFYTEGSFESFEKLSLVKGEHKIMPAEAMILILVKDHEICTRYLREHLPFVEQCEDGATADLINKRLAEHEKWAWMLRSQI